MSPNGEFQLKASEENDGAAFTDPFDTEETTEAQELQTDGIAEENTEEDTEKDTEESSEEISEEFSEENTESPNAEDAEKDSNETQNEELPKETATTPEDGSF